MFFGVEAISEFLREFPEQSRCACRQLARNIRHWDCDDRFCYQTLLLFHKENHQTMQSRGIPRPRRDHATTKHFLWSIWGGESLFSTQMGGKQWMENHFLDKTNIKSGRKQCASFLHLVSWPTFPSLKCSFGTNADLTLVQFRGGVGESRNRLPVPNGQSEQLFLSSMNAVTK